MIDTSGQYSLVEKFLDFCYLTWTMFITSWCKWILFFLLITALKESGIKKNIIFSSRLRSSVHVCILIPTSDYVLKAYHLPDWQTAVSISCLPTIHYLVSHFLSQLRKCRISSDEHLYITHPLNEIVANCKPLVTKSISICQNL